MTSFIAFYMISMGSVFIVLGICLLGIGFEMRSLRQILF